MNETPAPQGRKINLAKWGGVLVSGLAVVAVLWPEHAETLTKLGAAVAGLFSAIGAAIAYEDAAQARARADVDAAAIYAAKEQNCE